MSVHCVNYWINTTRMVMGLMAFGWDGSVWYGYKIITR